MSDNQPKRVSLRGLTIEVPHSTTQEEIEEHTRRVAAAAGVLQRRIEEELPARFAEAVARHEAAVEAAKRVREEMRRRKEEVSLKAHEDEKDGEGREERGDEKQDEKEHTEMKDEAEKGERGETTGEKCRDGEEKQGEKERDEKESEIETREEIETRAAIDRILALKMDFDDTAGLDEENEYIVERVLRGKQTVYHTKDEDERKMMRRLGMQHYMMTRGVDYFEALRRKERGEETDADEAIIQMAERVDVKATRPMHALWAARILDEVRDRLGEEWKKDKMEKEVRERLEKGRRKMMKKKVKKRK